MTGCSRIYEEGITEDTEDAEKIFKEGGTLPPTSIFARGSRQQS